MSDAIVIDDGSTTEEELDDTIHPWDVEGSMESEGGSSQWLTELSTDSDGSIRPWSEYYTRGHRTRRISSERDDEYGEEDVYGSSTDEDDDDQTILNSVEEVPAVQSDVESNTVVDGHDTEVGVAEVIIAPDDPGGGIDPAVAVNVQPISHVQAVVNILNTSTAAFKSPKKYKPQPPKPEVTTSPVGDDDDAAECPICFEQWSNSGEHRLAALKCGHLFGKSCIEKWIREQKPGRCPHCKAKAVKKDIRPLFAMKLKMVDTSDRDAAITALGKEREARQKAEMESAQNRLRIHMAQEEVHKLQRELEHSRQREANSLLTAPGGNVPLSQGSSNMSSNSFMIQRPCEKGYVFDQIVKVWDGGNCRVLTYDMCSAMLIASQPSSSPLFPGFGIKKISAMDFRTMQYVPIHQKVIRDIAFNPSTNDGLLLTCSLDKTVKATSMPSNMVVQTYTCPSPVWSCIWNSDNTNMLYAGLANGTVTVFDTRNTSGAVEQINTIGPGSPVVSLQYLNADLNSTFRPGGLLIGQLNRTSFFEYKGDEYLPHPLPMENGLTYLSLDCTSRHFLASYRPSQRVASVRHMVYQMSGISEANTASMCTANLIHTLHGGSTQKLLSRAKLLVHPSDNTKLLVCAPDESSLSLQIWDTATGNLCQKLPTQSEILDVTQVTVNGSHYLAALNEKVIRLYKWTTLS